jgi:hypothetical protein
MEYCPARTWSRSMARPESRFVHSVSGNCGSRSELRSETFASLRSLEKFSRGAWVCASEGDNAGGSISSWITQVKALTLIFRFVGLPPDESTEWLLRCLSCPAGGSPSPPSSPGSPSLSSPPLGSALAPLLSPALILSRSKLSRTWMYASSAHP